MYNRNPRRTNIGLISSLCVYAKINRLGFIETPYIKVENGKILYDQPPVYLSAEEEEDLTIAQATENIDSEKGVFNGQRIKARLSADFPIVTPEEVEAVDVAPNQITSITASLIPFLEHDDANRALMGSNMMRQAVPLLKAEAPIVGTGIEDKVAKCSRSQIYAEKDGVVEYVDASQIRIKYDRTPKEELVSFDSNISIYYLTKFQRTNQSTAINIVPIVKKGTKSYKRTSAYRRIRNKNKENWL